MSCKACKFNQPRTLKNKVCLKSHMAIFGFGCRDYEPIKESEPNETNYEIGYQISIFDIINEERRKRDE